MNTLTHGELFAGYGGLTMAVQAVLGGSLAWYSEYEPPTAKTPRPSQAAARVMAHHYPDVPNLGDVAAVDWSAVARVDVLSGGFPCQDVSSAGLRGGLRAGSRSGLWEHMATAIDVLRPKLVVIENVRGILFAGADGVLEPCPWCVGDDESIPLRALGCVLGDLADIGYDAQWCGLRASDVGGAHARFRVVVLAWPAANAERLRRFAGGGTGPAETSGRRACGDTAGRRNGAAPDAQGDGRREGRPESARVVGGPDAALGGDATTAHADRSALREQSVAIAGRIDPAVPGQLSAPAWGDYAPAIRRWERVLGRPAPAPTVVRKRGGQRLSPLFVEWLMGLPAGHVTAVPDITWNEALRVLGNGVVPQQIEAGVRYLLPGMEIR